MDFRTLILTGSQTIIGISGLLIITGLFFIKTGRKDLHKKAMLSASIFAFVFVILYLIRTAIFPHTKYTGPYRAFYLWIVFSHTLLASFGVLIVSTSMFLPVIVLHGATGFLLLAWLAYQSMPYFFPYGPGREAKENGL